MPGLPPGRYAYLGPEGTFCEAALRQLPAADAVDPMPCVSGADALDAVRRGGAAAVDAVRGGDAAAAVVPLENSVEGSVAETLDELAGGEPLHVAREILVPV